MKKHLWKFNVIFIAAVTLVMMLGGCTSKSMNSMSTDVFSETTAYDTENYNSEEKGVYANNSSADSTEAAENEISDSGSGIQAAPSENRKLIRTVDISAQTKEFDNLMAQLNKKITELGGYIEQSEVSGSSIRSDDNTSAKYALITARIPSDKLDSFVSIVKDGSNVIRMAESAEDITLRYSDIESRKKSIEIEQERLWALLEKADSLDSVIVLEQRLSEIRYELESYESQLRLYDNQVDYSIVNLSVSEVATIDLTPTQPESIGARIQRGFQKTLNQVVGFLTALFIGFITTSPIWILPALLLIFILLFSKKRRDTKKELFSKRNNTSVDKEEDAAEHTDTPRKEQE